MRGWENLGLSLGVSFDFLVASGFSSFCWMALVGSDLGLLLALGTWSVAFSSLDFSFCRGFSFLLVLVSGLASSFLSLAEELPIASIARVSCGRGAK